MYDFKTFRFGKGAHFTREIGMCVMEAVAYLAGEPHTDRPECASPIITSLAIWLNDAASDELRQELLQPLPFRIIGTRASFEIEHQRTYMATDWVVRTIYPMLLREADFEDSAKSLESLPVICDVDTADAAHQAIGHQLYRLCHGTNIAVSHCRQNDCVDLGALERFSISKHMIKRAVNYTLSMLRAVIEANEPSDVVKIANYAAVIANFTLEINARARECGLRSCADLLDRMISLTEIKEKVLDTRTTCRATSTTIS